MAAGYYVRRTWAELPNADEVPLGYLCIDPQSREEWYRRVPSLMPHRFATEEDAQAEASALNAANVRHRTAGEPDWIVVKTPT